MMRNCPGTKTETPVSDAPLKTVLLGGLGRLGNPVEVRHESGGGKKYKKCCGR